MEVFEILTHVQTEDLDYNIYKYIDTLRTKIYIITFFFHCTTNFLDKKDRNYLIESLQFKKKYPKLNQKLGIEILLWVWLHYHLAFIMLL